jgi:hypothetical protein
VAFASLAYPVLCSIVVPTDAQGYTVHRRTRHLPPPNTRIEALPFGEPCYSAAHDWHSAATANINLWCRRRSISTHRPLTEISCWPTRTSSMIVRAPTPSAPSLSGGSTATLGITLDIKFLHPTLVKLSRVLVNVRDTVGRKDSRPAGPIVRHFDFPVAYICKAYRSTELSGCAWSTETSSVSMLLR